MSDDLLDQFQNPIVAQGQTIWLDDSIPFNQAVNVHTALGDLKKTKYTLPLPYLSVSQVETFLACPRIFEFRYIKGQKSPKHSAMCQGSLIHAVIEKGYNYKRLERKDPPFEFVLDTYNDLFSENFNEAIRKEHETDQFLFKQAEILLSAWYKEQLPGSNPIAVEQKFIYDVNGIPVVGVIDLIDRTSEVDNSFVGRYHPIQDKLVDNKIIGKAMSQSDADNSLQMSVYAGATGIVEQRFNCLVKGNPDSLTKEKSKALKPRRKEVITYRSNAQVKWAGVIIEDVAKIISSGIFAPCAPDSWMCSEKACSFWSQCRGKLN